MMEPGWDKVLRRKEGLREQGGVRTVHSKHGGAGHFWSVPEDSKCGPRTLKGL